MNGKTKRLGRSRPGANSQRLTLIFTSCQGVPRGVPVLRQAFGRCSTPGVRQVLDTRCSSLSAVSSSIPCDQQGLLLQRLAVTVHRGEHRAKLVGGLPPDAWRGDHAAARGGIPAVLGER